MVNLVGSEGHSGPVIYENIEKILGWNGVTPHIFGKKQTRPFRKMGHVTIISNDYQDLTYKAHKIKNTLKAIA
jgi:5-(carboxyamino)imidazole ribonucleotide synthase